MVRYRIYNDPELRENGGYTETPNFEDVPEGYVEGYNYIIIQVEEPDPEIEYEIRVQNETTKYINRIVDGQNQHAIMISRIRMGLQNNRITQLEYDIRLSFHLQIREHLLSGCQNLALEKINQLGSENVGIDYFNEIYDVLSSYVEANFNSNFSRTTDIGGGGIKNPPKP